jgi:hypothetical protein
MFFNETHIKQKQTHKPHLLSASDAVLPNTVSINDRQLASGGFQIIPDGAAAAAAWAAFNHHGDVFLGNVEAQLDRLQDVLLDGDAYFNDYLDGNNINTQFFR